MSLLLLCEVFVLVLGRRLGAGGGRRQGPFLVNTGYLESALGEGTHSQRRSCVIISWGGGEESSPEQTEFQSADTWGDKPEAEFTGYNALNLPALYEQAMVSIGLEIL